MDDAHERTTASTNMEWCIRDASQTEVTSVEKVWVYSVRACMQIHLQSQLGLATAESYQLLSDNNRVLKNGSMDDAREFAELRCAMWARWAILTMAVLTVVYLPWLYLPWLSYHGYTYYRRAMGTMGFSEELQLQMLGVISICLQLGSISFSGGEAGRHRGNEACTVVGGDWAQWSAHLLGVEEEKLAKALTFRTQLLRRAA